MKEEIAKSVGIGLRIFAISFLLLVVGIPIFIYGYETIIHYSFIFGIVSFFGQLIYESVS
jgi:hypothetical protein